MYILKEVIVHHNVNDFLICIEQKILTGVITDSIIISIPDKWVIQAGYRSDLSWFESLSSQPCLGQVRVKFGSGSLSDQ